MVNGDEQKWCLVIDPQMTNDHSASGIDGPLQKWIPDNHGKNGDGHDWNNKKQWQLGQ